MLFFVNIEIFAQQGASGASTDVAFSEAPADVAFWVAYWGKPRVVLFGPEQEAFNQNVHEILFAWNDHDDASNPNILDENVHGQRIMQAIAFTLRVTPPQEATWATTDALKAKSGLGQANSDKQGHRGESDRVGGGMGAVVSSLSRTQR